MKNTWLAIALFITAIAAIVIVVNVYPHLPKTYNNEWQQVIQNDSIYRFSASPVNMLLQK